MFNNFITLLSVSIDVCIKSENHILKELLIDYAKEKLNKKQLLYLHIKLATVSRETSIYLFIDSWISNHKAEIIKQFLYRND
jgi:hypothetical protein